MLRVARLLAEATANPQDTLATVLVGTLREHLGLTRAALLTLSPGPAGQVVLAAAEPTVPAREVPVAALGLVAEALELGGPVQRPLGSDDAALARLLGAGRDAAQPPRSAELALVMPVRLGDAVERVVVLTDAERRQFRPEEVEVAVAFAEAAAAGRARAELAAERARQAALVHSARRLNESSDLADVLRRVCTEAAHLTGADVAAVLRGNAVDGLSVESVHGLAPEAVGHRLVAGEGVVGRVVQAGAPALSHDGVPGPDGLVFAGARGALAVPLRWNGELRGVILVTFRQRGRVSETALGLLESFAELAAGACRSAGAQAGLAETARTDLLTGCLNHAALQEGLRREIDRCRRVGGGLSLVLLDLDAFRHVNEEHGHHVGDEVLRRVGRVLRQALRTYDLVARYGGDQFALVLVHADEQEATEVALRAIGWITSVVSEHVPGPYAPRASAGVAGWTQAQSRTQLLADADRALDYAKREGHRGGVVTASSVPEVFRPGRFGRPLGTPPTQAEASAWTVATGGGGERLRRRTRQLATVNALGIRLAALDEPAAIVEAVVAGLHGELGYRTCAAFELGAGGLLCAVAGRGTSLSAAVAQGLTLDAAIGSAGRCLRERRPVLGNGAREEADDPRATHSERPRSELVAPVWLDRRPWGVLVLRESRAGAFDGDDVRVVQTVAEQTGAALRSVADREAVERAYLAAGVVLAGALEDPDGSGAARVAGLVATTVTVGRRMGMGEPELRTLRLATVLHDVGEAALPPSLLDKPGSLSEVEWYRVERHPVLGDELVGALDALADVRPLVRHVHERWDGQGYPDGLAGERIPFGARLILACDASHAMTRDRPGRPARSPAQAREELSREAGRQLDPQVVRVLLEVLDERERRPTAYPRSSPIS